jgi:ribosomal protein S18 acetylase RimI-like enzyme
MGTYTVRPLDSSDFDTLMTLEQRIFGDDPPGVLGPYYVRLCCDVYGDTCFLALDGDTPVAYLLAFTRGREVHCTTLAVVPEHQGGRVVALLLRSFVQRVVGDSDVCWFTVKPDNAAARALHASLGAEEVGVRVDYYGPGDERIVSKIDAERFERLRARYERLGLARARPRRVSELEDAV